MITELEKAKLEQALKDLYFSQGKNVKIEQIIFVAQQLAFTRYPFGAIIAGIKNLMERDLREVKLCTIMEAVREKITYEERRNFDCWHCRGSGYISMVERDKKSGSYCYACICEEGTRLKDSNKNMPRWNGELQQYYNGRWMTMGQPERHKIPPKE